VADVYTGGWVEANLEVAEGRFAYLGPRTPRLGPSTRRVLARGLYAVPGYLEPHAHPWVLYHPLSLLEALVPQGVTTLVYDDLLFRSRLGPEGTLDAIRRLRTLPLPARVLFATRLAPQSLLPEGEEAFPLEALPLLEEPGVALAAEITRWPQVVAGEEGLLEGILRAHLLGRRAEAHGAGASYAKLAALAAAGLDADHEALTAEEVLNRLRLGFWTMLRHSSLRPDLPALLEGLPLPPSPRLLLTTDGAAPSFYAREGFPGLLRRVSAWAGPIEALRLATLNPATFLALDGLLGGLAPGRLADFLLLEAPDAFAPLAVYVGGELVAREGRLLEPLPAPPWRKASLGFVRAPFGDPDRYLLGSAPVLRLENAVITRQTREASEGVAAFLLDPGGRWRVGAWVEGFLPRLEGFATTFTAVPGLLVLGKDPRAMARAAEAVAAMGGGFAWARADQVVWAEPLPLWGYMVDGPFSQALAVEERLWKLASAAGYPHGDILYSLLFLTCDFLPDLRLTPRGVWAVKEHRAVTLPEAF
jgi:adenine deaminase